MSQTAIKIKELELEIAKKVWDSNEAETTFKYKRGKNVLEMLVNPLWIVQAFTTNKKSEETFLLKEVKVKEKIEGLNKIKFYLNDMNEYDSYTIEWTKKDSPMGITKSFFFVHNIKEAVEKFYHDKDESQYHVYHIEKTYVNPRS